MRSKQRKIVWVWFLLMILVLLGNPVQADAATSWMEVADAIQLHLEDALVLYESGDVDGARLLVSDAYFGPFEEQGMEAAVKMNISASRAFELEYGFSELKQMMKGGASQAEVEKKVVGLVALLREDALNLDGGGGKTPWSGFVSALLIILREGLEAILILAAIIAYLAKTGNQGRIRTIYQAALTAVAASLITAWLVSTVLHLSGAAQEVLEGITMLLAMLVLFFVSYWLLSKVQAEKWQQYIEGKVRDSLTMGNSWALWWVVFLAVYREGAETVLFYQALLGGGTDFGAVLGGLVVGSVILAVVFVLVRIGSVRLPLKPFFAVTGALLYYMAFSFAGHGVKELQESGWLVSSGVAGVPVIDFLGIYPTWQSLGLQAILILAAIYGLVYQRRKSF